MTDSNPLWLIGGIIILVLYLLLSGLTEMGTKWPWQDKHKQENK
ncbi:hypothetical protein [Spirulina sp. 06S082]|nr:hypothetical protein [Spirulina sp. 06S082]MEA5469632.1 hypothetical protein [Spirulina sp. 06S082]